MTGSECIAILGWALPLVGLRPDGFRNVRRQVCRRLAARARSLRLDARGYRLLLEASPAEREVLRRLAHVTISRFYRDARVWDALGTTVLPALAAGDGALRAWSAGCASGEEPYTLALVWQLAVAPRFPDARLEITATDADPEVLARAASATYRRSSVTEMPAAFVDVAFDVRGDDVVLRPPFREGVTFVAADLRALGPGGPLHVVLCRNVVFTYHDEAGQRAFAAAVAATLAPGGVLVVGKGEIAPGPFVADRAVPEIFRLA
jgi:chemotaxis protein methyltransferase CheR